MSSERRFSTTLLRLAIALVWLGNGLFAKLLGMAPRHQEIVTRILGPSLAAPLTLAIGFGEVVMCLWVLSGWRSRVCAVVQMGLVMAMNLIEFTLAPDLLLWGRFNVLFATGFVVVIYWSEFRGQTDDGGK